MPKMKTHSGAKKRFKKTAKGKLIARHSFTSHNLGKKSAKRKRALGRLRPESIAIAFPGPVIFPLEVGEQDVRLVIRRDEKERRQKDKTDADHDNLS